MTWFKGQSNIDHQRAKDYLNKLISEGKDFEIKQKRLNRTYKQNNYLHLLFSYFGLQTGYSPDEVKQIIFKQIVNPDYFDDGERNVYGVFQQKWRSTADLDTKEMTTCTERFLDWSVKEADIRLPEPSDLVFLREIEIEIENNKQYL